MRDKVEQPIPETRIISKDYATDHSGRHWLIVATDSARTHSPLSDFLSEEHYGAPAQIEQGNCNQVGRVGSRVQGLRSAVQWLSGVQRSQGVDPLQIERRQMPCLNPSRALHATQPLHRAA